MRSRRSCRAPCAAVGDAAERHEITRRLARGVAIDDRAIEAHRETVAGAQAPALLADGHLHFSLDDPDLLMDFRVAQAGVVGHALARRELHFHELQRRPERGREIAAHVTRSGIGPDRLFPGDGERRGLGGRRAVGCFEQRGERDAERRREFVEHDGGGAALSAFDQRNIRAADRAAIGERIERPAARVAQFAQTLGKGGVDVHAVSGLLEIDFQ
ncbi:hypothetical protein PT2222_350044 [Paraburkholderia tropica]